MLKRICIADRAKRFKLHHERRTNNDMDHNVAQESVTSDYVKMIYDESLFVRPPQKTAKVRQGFLAKRQPIPRRPLRIANSRLLLHRFLAKKPERILAEGLSAKVGETMRRVRKVLVL